MSRKYDPKKRYKNSPAGRMSPSRIAWVRADWLDIVYARTVADRNVDEEHQPEVSRERINHMLLIEPKNRRSVRLNLSALTLDELEAVKEIIDRVFEEARGECHTRDTEAQEAYERDGDDSFTRLYRPVPRVIYREGEKPPNGEGLRIGSQGPALIERSQDEDDG